MSMYNTVNKVILVGDVFEIKTVTFGNTYQYHVTLTTDFRWTDKNTGEIKYNREFHRVIICQGTASVISVGDKLYVEGHLQNRSYLDKDNKKCFITEVFVGNRLGEVFKILHFKNPRTTEQNYNISDDNYNNDVDDSDDIPF